LVLCLFLIIANVGGMKSWGFWNAFLSTDSEAELETKY